MINVTLSFASVEEMLAFFNKPEVPAKGKPAAKVEAAPTPPTATEPVAAPAPKAEASAPAAAPTPAPAAPTVSYEAVGVAIQSLVAKNRAKAVEILASFGAKKGPELKPEQYADALAKFTAALAEAEAALS